MKKLLFTMILAVAISFTAISQGNVCSSHIYKYSGPKNTDQLAQVLRTSTNPVIARLSEETKNSLIKSFVFADGLPAGMNGPDENIERLYRSNAAEVFSAILGSEVIITTSDAPLEVREISVAEFETLLNNNPAGRFFVSVWSECKNCYFGRDGDSCCHVGGYGCWDNAVALSSKPGVYYHVRNR